MILPLFKWMAAILSSLPMESPLNPEGGYTTSSEKAEIFQILQSKIMLGSISG